MERSSCHCHCISSALTNTRDPPPGLIPLLTVVTHTMSLLLEQLFLLISIFLLQKPCLRKQGIVWKNEWALNYAYHIRQPFRGSFWVSMLHYSPNVTKRYLNQQAGEHGLTSRETHRCQSSCCNHGKYRTPMSPLALSLAAVGMCASTLIWAGSCGCQLDLSCCSYLAHNYF